MSTAAKVQALANSIFDRNVSELMPLLCCQLTGDSSHKLVDRLTSLIAHEICQLPLLTDQLTSHAVFDPPAVAAASGVETSPATAITSQSENTTRWLSSPLELLETFVSYFCLAFIRYRLYDTLAGLSDGSSCIVYALLYTSFVLFSQCLTALSYQPSSFAHAAKDWTQL